MFIKRIISNILKNTGIAIFFVAMLVPCLYGATVDNANLYFSPNLDSSKDVFPVPLSIKESVLDKWSVDIFRRDGAAYKVIRHYESLNSREIEKLTAKKFFSRIFARDKAVDVPSLVNWDGLDENGVLLKDGEYYLSIFARDRAGNETRSPLIPIFLDTVAPEATPELQDNIFSPNEDGNKENLIVKISTNNFQQFDTRVIEVLDENGNVVHSEESRTPGDTWQWNGNSDDKKIPEGRYLLNVSAKDYAGNKSIAVPKSFVLVRAYETLKFSIEPFVFSPNKDAAFDEATFVAELSSANGLEQWRIDVLNEKDNILRTFTGKELSSKIVFDGMDNNEKLIPDQNLKVVFSAKFRSGNAPSSEAVPLKLDNTPPKLSLQENTKVFNPDATSGASSMNVSQSSIAEPNDKFLGVIEDAQGRVVYETNFDSSLPVEFSWNGENSFGEKIPGMYKYVLMGKDAVGNVSLVKTEEIRLVMGDIAGGLSSSRLAFSPNGDEVKDRTVFLLKLDDTYKSLLTTGNIFVAKDADGKNIVRSFFMEDFTPEVPWDGKDKDGKLLSDGEYFFTGKFVFSTGEEIDFASQAIYIDRKPIEGSIAANNPLFSPNEDGRQDEYVVENSFKESEILPDYDNFLVRIESTEGNLVRENAWKKDLPKTIKWNGRDQNGNLMKEGVYVYKVFSEDEAGNRRIFETQPVQLALTAPALQLNINQPVVSGRKDAVITNVSLQAVSDNSKGMNNLEYVLVNDVGEEFSLQSYSSEKKKYSLPLLASAQPLPLLAWDVVAYEKSKSKEKRTGDKNFYLASGNYVVKAVATYSSGLVAFSKDMPLVIDNESPENGVASRPQYFSPDRDGENEVLSLRFIATDNDKVAANSAELFRRVDFENSKGKKFEQSYSNYSNKFRPFKVFNLPSGGDVDFMKEWDGIGDDGSLVESANDYVLFFASTDRVGLTTQSINPIEVDIFIEKLSDGRLKIVINSINFKYNSDKMIGGYENVLARLVRMLNKFPNYEILITGHTDSRGSENYNKELSLKRAKRVYNFLTGVARIPKKQINYEGRGESELFIADEVVTSAELSPDERAYLSEENYRKNRRVEFFLENKEKGQ